ncbi:MAG: beta-N-acetylhexosaminidase [Desulfomonile sp.]|nr:beta-N-acetylhexosaminidase [Desulfomonile sp.]
MNSRTCQNQRDVGAFFLVGFRGTELDSEARDFLDEMNPAGVILFKRNVEDPVQVARLSRALQEYAQTRLGKPWFIAVDQEGGRVARLREPFTVFPPALELARSPDPESAVREFARVTAHELRLAGFNLDFVPVLDVLNSADAAPDSVIGDRSFGSDPAVVSRLGRVVIETMRSAGVITCCKHFPGHGGTTVDSHKALPVDRRDRATLEQIDLVPFREAIAAQVDMTMTAHVVYPAIDPDYPATLSPAHIRGYLRESLGFAGVVATDDLDMYAVADGWSPGECVELAVAAGADLLLVCNDPSRALAAQAGLYGAVKEGRIQPDRLDQSLKRIQAVQERYASSMVPCDPDEVRLYVASRAQGRQFTG